MICVVEVFEPPEKKDIRSYKAEHIDAYPDRFNNLIVEVYKGPYDESKVPELDYMVIYHKDNWIGFSLHEREW